MIILIPGISLCSHGGYLTPGDFGDSFKKYHRVCMGMILTLHVYHGSPRFQPPEVRRCALRLTPCEITRQFLGF